MGSGTVLILGGGIGGQVAAKAVRRRLPRDDRVVLVERSPRFSFAPSLLWVMSGARRPPQITAGLGRLRRAGVEVQEAEAVAIDLDRHQCATSAGMLAWDRLVVALGAELAPGLLPGFAEAAHNLYTLGGVVAARDALHAFRGGRIAILVSRLPYKCPAAPYEAAFLTDAVLRRRGVRGQSTIDIYTPEPFPMPTAGPEIGRALAGVLKVRTIGFHPELSVDRIEVGTRELILADGERVGYDLLLGVPPHQPPGLVQRSGLDPIVPCQADRGSPRRGSKF